jgi:hypothetical protein
MPGILAPPCEKAALINLAAELIVLMDLKEPTTTVTKIFPRIGLVRKTKGILADLSPD